MVQVQDQLTPIVPVTDQDLYQVAEFWTYPNGYGDCEDYALAKRREIRAQDRRGQPHGRRRTTHRLTSREIGSPGAIWKPA